MKKLLVTGATGGLGQAVVARFERDYDCVLLGRSENPLNALREPVFGALLLAGAFTMGSSSENFAAMIDANLMSAVRVLDPITPKIVDGGRIVAISSAASLTRPPGMAAYVASKAALNGYLESLAKELAPRHITVNALLPTALDTPAMRNSMPHNRLVPLERVTETIAFLLSDNAQSVTGQMIVLSAD
jgi:NAD(P)-dependent dehydrogenase (short-subunit alcohol dehydrogenase family)